MLLGDVRAGGGFLVAVSFGGLHHTVGDCARHGDFDKAKGRLETEPGPRRRMHDIAIQAVHADHGIEVQPTDGEPQKAGGQRDFGNLTGAGLCLLPRQVRAELLDGMKIAFHVLDAVHDLAAAVDEASGEKKTPKDKERLTNDQQWVEFWFDRSGRLGHENDREVDGNDACQISHILKFARTDLKLCHFEESQMNK